MLENIQYFQVLRITKFFNSSLNFSAILNHAELSLIAVQLQTYQPGFPKDHYKILCQSEMSNSPLNTHTVVDHCKHRK